MPLWLRRFTFDKIREFYDNKAKATEKSQPKIPGQTTVIDSTGKVKAPEHLKRPTYR